jgi:hypothetical protein
MWVIMMWFIKSWAIPNEGAVDGIYSASENRLAVVV